MTGGNPRAFCSAARDGCEPASHPRGAAGAQSAHNGGRGLWPLPQLVEKVQQKLGFFVYKR